MEAFITTSSKLSALEPVIEELVALSIITAENEVSFCSDLEFDRSSVTVKIKGAPRSKVLPAILTAFSDRKNNKNFKCSRHQSNAPNENFLNK